jgi:hypothetical protein
MVYSKHLFILALLGFFSMFAAASSYKVVTGYIGRCSYNSIAKLWNNMHCADSNRANSSVAGFYMTAEDFSQNVNNFKKSGWIIDGKLIVKGNTMYQRMHLW